MTTWRGRLVTAVLFAAGALGLGSSIARAEPRVDGVATAPVVALDRYEVAPGDQVTVTIAGFRAQAVTISICGNEARRGSSDCNMAASEGVRLARGGDSTIADLPITAPPVACPCLVRVSNANQDEVAVVAITLLGHPVEPVVGNAPATRAVTVEIDSVPSASGVVARTRAWLGGPVRYDVTIRVTNQSATAVSAMAVTGTVGRAGDDDLERFEVPEPGVIDPGQTWTVTTHAELPAPVYGQVEWRATVSGVGSAVTAIDRTSHRPWLLYVCLVVLAADVLALLTRWTIRRRRA